MPKLEPRGYGHEKDQAVPGGAAPEAQFPPSIRSCKSDGLQSLHVSNQSLIYRVPPEAQSRLVAGCMIFYSIGSAIGSIVSTMVYAHAGWSGVSLVGAATSASAGTGVLGADTARRHSPGMIGELKHGELSTSFPLHGP